MCAQLVPAESVTGAREAEGEAWCVDDLDVEQAAREQAAAARNKRRAMQDDGEFIDPAFPTPYGASPLGEPLGGTRSGSISRGGLNAVHLLPPGMGRASRPFGGAPAGPSVSHKRKSPGGGTLHKAGAAPARKRKRLAPASNSCLACTKGKHCAHTCGVRGKAAEAAAAAAKAEAEAAAAGTA